MLSNSEVASMMKTLSELMELHGANEFAAKSLSVSAFQIGRLTENVIDMNKAALEKQFNKTVVTRVNEIKETGTIELLEELVQPPGIFEMMRIKGLGGKKLAVIWKQAGIENLDALLKACRSNELAQISGFGEKTEQNIIKSIEYYKNNSGKFHFATVADEADKIVELLKQIFKTDKISLCGDVRRQSNVVEKIEILCAFNEKKFLLNKSAFKFLIVENLSSKKITGHTLNELPISVYFTSEKDFYYELFIKTGNREHVNKIIEKLVDKVPAFKSEKAIYEKAGFSYILPELREDLAEWEFATQKAESLITDIDIKGVVHNHTTWSDGIDTLKDFVSACQKKGFEYVVISDHSKNAHYAGGLIEEQIIKQHGEIDSLNKKLSPFKIFKSIESDILISGDLDYTNSFLKRFDLVIISVHQLLKMDEEKATRRLLKAIENPHTTILGHMTGRQLLIRSGFPVNAKKIIDACAENDVIIEMNANPYRLDMDYTHIPYALEKGVMISINPDAHSIGEIDNIHWGVVSARKGGLTKEMTWNAMSLKEIDKWLKGRRIKKGI